MSVLINGLKMPTSCLKGGCPLDGFACQLWEDKYWSRVESPEKMRHKNCPLIELPDHGDLIEREKAVKALEDLISARLDWTSAAKVEEIRGLDAAICAVIDVKKVIPAERSEDGET